jgi:anthranilate phosphoribosyltransferase
MRRLPFLTAMTLRDETSVEIAAAARALRARMIPITAPEGAIDVCGTGGDGAHSLNISTAVAIVVAACGVPVAKHGNRAASSKAGAADTLEALGLDLDRASARPRRASTISASPSCSRRSIIRRWAAWSDPARDRAADDLQPDRSARQSGAGHAPADRRRAGRLSADGCRALDLLGSEGALVVSGEESLDELSIAGPSRAVAIGSYRGRRPVDHARGCRAPAPRPGCDPRRRSGL